MALDIPFLQGTTLENNGFAGKAGVISIDVEKKELRIHDGLTFGGHIIPGAPRVDELKDAISGLGIEVIDGLQDQLDLKLAVSLLGMAGGVAQLDANGQVPASQLPSFVNDVEEYDTLESLPIEGEAGKLYVTVESGFIYRWDGVGYKAVSARISDTDELVEGSNNLYYTPARVRTVFVTSGDITYEMESGVFTIETPFETVNGQSADTNGNLSLDKTHVGLNNVENYLFATEVEAAAGDSDELYLSPMGVRQSLEMVNVIRTDGQWLLYNGTLSVYIVTEEGDILTTEDGADLDFEL